MHVAADDDGIRRLPRRRDRREEPRARRGITIPPVRPMDEIALVVAPARAHEARLLRDHVPACAGLRESLVEPTLLRGSEHRAA